MIEVVAQLIKDFMALDNDQIYIYNQDFNLNNSGKLQVIIQYTSSEPYSITNKFIPADEGVEGAKEKIVMLVKENYTINIVSKGEEARTRKEELLLALITNQAANIQEQYQFKLANLPNNFIDISGVEGAGSLNRYAINISLLTYHSKELDTAYYDTFDFNNITAESA
jgi:hypothetical protein